MTAAPPPPPTTALTLLTTGDPLDRATAWAHMAPDERRRRALAACRDHDAGELWVLTDAWLTLHGRRGAHVSPYTRRNYRQGVEAFTGAWQQESLTRPRKDAGAVWVRGMEAAGLATSTVRVRIAAARALYAALRWCEATALNPLADVRTAKDPTPPWDKRHPYTEEEIAALLAQARPIERALVLLGAHGGLRLSECLNLRWQDVDVAAGHLDVTQGKGGKQRRVFLSGTATEALRALHAHTGPTTDYVFPFRAPIRARERLVRLCTAAGVPYRGIHSLRHFCGTRLVRESQGNLELAAAHLGHADIQTTRTYSHWANDAVRAAIARW